MNKVRETVVSVAAPVDKNVIWIDISGEKAIQKIFRNGQWEDIIGGASGDVMTKVENPTAGNILTMDSTGQAINSEHNVSDFLATPSTTGQEGEVLSVDNDGNPIWTTITPTGTADNEMSNTSTNAVQNKVIKEYIDDNYARKDGYYSQMTVGSAENLVGQTVDSEAYLIRPTGGTENEAASGVVPVLGMEGNSCVWNQCINYSANPISMVTTDQNVTVSYEGEGKVKIIVSGPISTQVRFRMWLSSGIDLNTTHKYAIMIKANTSLFYDGGNGLYWLDNNTIRNNSTITTNRSKLYSDIFVGTSVIEGTYYITRYVIDLTLMDIDNLTTTKQVKEWLAQHVGTKPYYAYNAGTILSSQTLGIKTYGQNLLNPTTKKAKLIPYEWEDNSNVYTIKNVPSGATATFTPDNTGVAETVDISGGSIDITTYDSGILELSAATADTYVCMKWDEQKDDDVVPYEDHTYDFDVRKVYGKVSGAGEYVQGFPNGMRSAGNVHDTLSVSEAVVKVGSRAYQSGDESDSAVITDGTNTLYALVTPITYTDLIYRDGGIDRPLVDVLMNIEVNNWSIEEQLMTPYVDGNPTSIPATIKTQYGMDAVEAIDTLQKTCYFADDVKANLQALLNCVNTNCSETLGGTFSVSDTATDKVFEFTFTPNT